MDSDTYQTRLIGNLCTGAEGCTRPPVDGASQCVRHLKAARRRSKLYKQRIRDAREAAGQCRGCGTPRKPGQRCAVCLAKRPERIALEAGHAAVHDRGDPFRKDSDGWKRYRGKGRRGAPGAAVNDAEDLAFALKRFERGRQAFDLVHSDAVKALPKVQRRAVTNEEIAHLGLAIRTASEVIARHGEERAATPGTGADATWDYHKAADTAEIASGARAGEYVYAPPSELKPGQPVTERKPPSLAPLREALAARGLALQPEGAYYWLVVEAS